MSFWVLLFFFFPPLISSFIRFLSFTFSFIICAERPERREKIIDLYCNSTAQWWQTLSAGRWRPQTRHWQTRTKVCPPACHWLVFALFFLHFLSSTRRPSALVVIYSCFCAELGGDCRSINQSWRVNIESKDESAKVFHRKEDEERKNKNEQSKRKWDEEGLLLVQEQEREFLTRGALYMTCFDGTRTYTHTDWCPASSVACIPIYIHQCTACVYVLLELWFRSPLRWKRVDRFDRRRGWAQVVCVASMTPFYLTVNNAMTLSLKLKTFGEISCVYI